MSLSRYGDYKPVELGWLSDVPAHWNVFPLKRVAELQLAKRDVAPTDQYVGLENVSSWTGEIAVAGTAADGLGIEFAVGDVLFGKLRPYLAKVALAHTSGIGSTEFLVLRGKQVEPNFLRYSMVSRPFIDAVNASTYGAKMPRANWEDIGSLPQPVPPLAEQRAIADFLDRETAKIDALVAKQEQLIERIEEERQATLTELVLRGLNRDVPTVEGPVEGWGRIPAHWRVLRLKHLSKTISKGTTPSTIGAELTTSGIRFLKAENISNERVSAEPAFFIDEETNDALARSKLRERDILMVIAGATTGKSAVLTADLIPANTNQAVCFIRLKDPTYATFVQSWLRSKFIFHQVWTQAVQSAQPHLSMEDVGRLQVPVPPKEEVEPLAAKIESSERAVAEALAKVNQFRRTLIERRSALITAAVTGQIKVGNTFAAEVAA